MREAHARNPQLRHAPAGRQKRCGHCGEVGHNRKTCPQLVAAQEERLVSLGLRVQPSEPKPQGLRAQAASPQPDSAPPAGRVIVIEEVDDARSLESAALASVEAAASTSDDGSGAGASTTVQSSAADVQPTADDGVAGGAGQPLPAAGAAPAIAAELAAGQLAAAAPPPQPPSPKPQQPQQPLQRQPDAAELLGGEGPLPYSEVFQTRWLAPGFTLNAEGGWVFHLPQSKEECVAQAAQVWPGAGVPAACCRCC